MYSYVKDNGKNEKTAKGIRKYMIKKNIAHQDYKDTLQNNKQIYHTMKTIRGVCHQFLKQLLDILGIEYKFIPLSKSRKTLNYYNQWWKEVYGLIKNDIA